jgi:hypothetical protein
VQALRREVPDMDLALRDDTAGAHDGAEYFKLQEMRAALVKGTRKG